MSAKTVQGAICFGGGFLSAVVLLLGGGWIYSLTVAFQWLCQTEACLLNSSW